MPGPYYCTVPTGTGGPKNCCFEQFDPEIKFRYALSQASRQTANISYERPTRVRWRDVGSVPWCRAACRQAMYTGDRFRLSSVEATRWAILTFGRQYSTRAGTQGSTDGMAAPEQRKQRPARTGQTKPRDGGLSQHREMAGCEHHEKGSES
ncbi:hypothetical protein BDZ89DRAFT_1045402 [Hymenopellis radicata]|nr:hypothetical protein BDZ89DRAFT_1045402 [Hymenopellis radicata]